MKTYSANAIAETFERDRGVVIRALRNTRPDSVVSGRPRWKLATASRALERHNRAGGVSNCGDGSSGGQDPELALMFAKFDSGDAAMRKLKTVSARRRAAIALAPLIAETDTALRAHGRATGAGAELADYRADRLLLLCLRGFEVPCEWSQQETLEHLAG